MTKTILARNLSAEILQMADFYPVITVLGPRQSGKTTLIKALFPEKPYVSLENLDERALAESDPRGFLARFPKGAIFDEIQRLPLLLSYLQGIVDESAEKGLFILTGSHQLALHEAISQSLAGRTAILKLLPFAIDEIKELTSNFTLEDYIYHGMYPHVYNTKLNPTKFYRDYMQTYIERDVRQIINIKDLALFQNFLKLCAGRVSQIFNSQSISNELGVSSHTIKNWLSILEASFIITKLSPYFENFGKRIIKAPKIYFTDVGLAAYLLNITTVEQLQRDPLRGNLVENLIIMDCMKYMCNKGLEPNFYFYRDSNQNEVDLLYKKGSLLIPIEIKASQTFHPNFLKGLQYFEKLVKDKYEAGALIYAGLQELNLKNNLIVNYKHVYNLFSEQL